MHQSI